MFFMVLLSSREWLGNTVNAEIGTGSRCSCAHLSIRPFYHQILDSLLRSGDIGYSYNPYPMRPWHLAGVGHPRPLCRLFLTRCMIRHCHLSSLLFFPPVTLPPGALISHSAQRGPSVWHWRPELGHTLCHV